MRWAFRGLLVGAIAVLGMDLRDMHREDAALVSPMTSTPLLPPAFETDKPLRVDPRPFVKEDEEVLRQSMQFTLDAGGVLNAVGSIDAAAFERLETELNSRGEYIQTVSLNSPGGELESAMAMARLLRARKVSTEVVDGALCASSCPIIFAGGEHRLAGSNAAVGVHQFFASTKPSAAYRISAAQALSDAQLTTARVSRFLAEMGVDPAAWLHAMDTPPQELYYFSVGEMEKYRLITGSTKAQARTRALPDSAG